MGFEGKSIEVSVILPTYNEAENILPLIERIKQVLKNFSYEIIVVDDNSPDKTWELVEKLNQEEVKVIKRISERGLVKSIRCGIQNAKGEYIIWMDADQSMPPELIPKLLDPLNQYDISVASRYVKGGKDKRTTLRIITSKATNLFANLFLGFQTLDYTSGFIALRKIVFDKVTLIDSVYGEYCIDFLYQSRKNGFKIKEVPYVFIDREAGVSKTASENLKFFKFGLIYLKQIIKSRYSKN